MYFFLILSDQFHTLLFQFSGESINFRRQPFIYVGRFSKMKKQNHTRGEIVSKYSLLVNHLPSYTKLMMCIFYYIFSTVILMWICHVSLWNCPSFHLLYTFSVHSLSWFHLLYPSLCDKGGQWLMTRLWLSPVKP
jgi:hypothetical protein